MTTAIVGRIGSMFVAANSIVGVLVLLQLDALAVLRLCSGKWIRNETVQN